MLRWIRTYMYMQSYAEPLYIIAYAHRRIRQLPTGYQRL